MTFSEKLKRLRAEKNLKQSELAQLLGVSQGSVGNWETGKRIPDTAMLTQIARHFAVSLDYLLGNTEIRAVSGARPPIADNTRDCLYQKYSALDQFGKNAVDGLLEHEIKRCHAQITATTQHTENALIETIEIKLCNMSASAGSGDYLTDDGYEYYTAPRTELTERADYAVRVNGDSMEPTFYDGDILLVRNAPYVNKGDIGIFVVNGEGYVKEFGGSKLISHNKCRADIPLTEHDVVICSGLVIGVL